MTESKLPPHILEQLPPDIMARIKANPRQLHRALFRIADAYTATASLALKQLQATGQTDLGNPSIICASFPIELLLKFFIAVEHPSRTGPEWTNTRLMHGHAYSNGGASWRKRHSFHNNGLLPRSRRHS